MGFTAPHGMGCKGATAQHTEIDRSVKADVSRGRSSYPIMSYFSDYCFESVVIKTYPDKLREQGRAGLQ